MKEWLRGLGNSSKLRILDCGIGAGWVGRSIREVFNNEEAELVGLEVYLPYIIKGQIRDDLDRYKVYHDLYDSIISGEYGNFCHFLPKQPSKSFDVIIFGDSLEHVEKEKAKEILKLACEIARKGVIVNIPIIELPQGTVHGNVHETHLSTWSRKELEDLGGKWFGGAREVAGFVWEL